MTVTRPVTFDINVLIDAVVRGNSTFISWPTPPPVSDNPAADCVGIVNDAAEFGLVLSSHILKNIVRVLLEGYEWSADATESYARILTEISFAGGSGIIEPAVSIEDCVDDEDNRILELAWASQSMLIVSNDHHLLELSPWRGTPIVPPAEFSARVDVMRRSRRR